MSPPEEIPSMVKLDAPQLGEVLLLIFAAESIVDGGCRESSRHANGTGDEPVVLAADGIQDGRVENGHEVGKGGGTGGRHHRWCAASSTQYFKISPVASLLRLWLLFRNPPVNLL